MKFFSNVLKTLSTLDLHAEKERQTTNGISKHLFIDQFMNGQMNSNFFNNESVD